MKTLLISLFIIMSSQAFSQSKVAKEESQFIVNLINSYSKARETKDTTLLKNILTKDMDQLVSSGEWRNGINESVEGMMQSSSSNPGERTLKVEKIRFLADKVALVDARYLIKTGSSTRKLWSTFLVVDEGEHWKISAIRNMQPSGD